MAVRLWLLLALLAWGSCARAAEPGASDWVRSDSGTVRLIADRLGGGADLRLGVQFRLQPGWKIYWRSPGEAGYPPRLDWAGSNNLAGTRLLWPAPHRFILSGLQNFGYSGEVVLPIEAHVADPARPLTLRARLDFLACATLCVPQSADLALDLPAHGTTDGAGGPTAFAHDIDRFAAQIPGDGLRHGLSLVRVEGLDHGARPVLRVTVDAALPFDSPDLFVEGDDAPPFEAPDLRLSPDHRRAVFDLPVAATGGSTPLAGRRLVLTVADGFRSMESEALVAPAAAESERGLAAMLLVALLGGLVLNLMPCVLPVLSIKILGVIGQGGGERRHVRASFLASSAGILASFLALAGLAVGLRAAGEGFGWGLQFQQPGFLALMVVLLGLFAANLWGLFEIPLPGWLFNRRASSIAHHTLAAHFLSGAFATLLATPCSAPFLGTAIGFALARGPAEIVAIFTALGIGMAAPYLLLAARPGLATALPRPGAWMGRVRALLGLALAGTAVWLLIVMAAEAGPRAAALSGSAIALAVALLALTRQKSGRVVAALVAALAALGLAGPLLAGRLAPPPAAVAGGAVPWVPFAPDRIPALVAQGTVVFVDVTADWCITCKVNKITLIERDSVAQRLSAPGMVAMQADWTRPDARIAAYLARFGRYGIPFNAVHGPGAPDGIALSELPGEAELLAALERAK